MTLLPYVTLSHKAQLFVLTYAYDTLPAIRICCENHDEIALH